jgi:uncharacterized protein YjdB
MLKKTPLFIIRGCLIAAIVTSLTMGMSACSSNQKLTSISLLPAFPTDLAVGSTLSFSAFGIYSNGLNKDISSRVNWTSSDNSVATIDSDAMVTGIAIGTTNITASLSGMISSPAILTVKLLSSIVVTPASTVGLNVGATQQFIASGTYSDGSDAIIRSLVTWTSSDNNIATISAGGIVTGETAGTTEITANLDEVISQPVTLTVFPTAATTSP